MVNAGCITLQDLFSVMVCGPTGTPYEGGMFFFDVRLTSDYPHSPPKIHYYSYCSDRLNPNLYEDGKVRAVWFVLKDIFKCFSYEFWNNFILHNDSKKLSIRNLIDLMLSLRLIFFKTTKLSLFYYTFKLEKLILAISWVVLLLEGVYKFVGHMERQRYRGLESETFESFASTSLYTRFSSVKFECFFEFLVILMLCDERKGILFA